MEETKEKILADKMSGLTDENRDAINNAINESLETAEAIKTFENDSDVLKLKAQEAELMNMFADPKFMKAYKNIRRDIYGYGVGERRQVTQKEKKKKKAKRRMEKKSRR